MKSNLKQNHFLAVLALAGVLAIGLMPVNSQAQQASQPLKTKDVMGKVVAVYHEPVKINEKWLDKVSVTVEVCNAPPHTFYTGWYSPGGVSDDNALGYLFNHHAVAARSTIQKNQYLNSVSGHVTLTAVDTPNQPNQNQILKTTYWGYNYECGRDLDAGGAPVAGGGGYGGNTSAPSTGGSSSSSSSSRGGGARIPVGVPGLGRFGF